MASSLHNSLSILSHCTGPDNIREHNLKRILGLMWSIFHRYQIRTHEGTGEKATEGKKPDDNVFKTLLLGWIQASLPGYTISNFTTSWNDGRNLSALVDYCKPGLIPEHASLSPDTALENISAAMDLAWENFGIPKIMRAEDLATANPDARSVMLYLSHFCCPDASGEESIGQKILLEWIHQQIPKQKVINLTTDWMDGCSLGALTNVISGGGFPDHKDMDASDAVKNCGKCLDAAEQLFSIEKSVSAEAFAREDTNRLVRMTYLTHLRHVEPKSKVQTMLSEASKCVIIAGPVIPTEATSPVSLRIDTSQAGDAMLHAEARGESDSLVAADVQALESSQFDVFFTAPIPEKYNLSVLWGDHPVPGSPFSLDLRVPNPTDVTLAEPPQLSVESGQPIGMCFNTSKGGRGRLTAVCIGEEVGSVAVEVKKQSDCRYAVTLVPPKTDLYKVSILWAGIEIPQSPFTINLRPIDLEKVKAIGPTVLPSGLVELELVMEGAGKGEVSASCLSSNGEDVAVSITESSDSGELYQLRFKPPEPDTYTLEVRFGGQDINGSPFSINTTSNDVQDAAEIVSERHEMYLLESSTECYTIPDHITESPAEEEQGAAMTPNELVHEQTLYIGEPFNLVVGTETEEQKRGDFTTSAEGESVGSVGIMSETKDDGTYLITFDPSQPDKYTLNVNLDDKPVPSSPFIIRYIVRPDASKCALIGLENIPKSPEVSKEITFKVDTKDAGEGKLSVTADGPRREQDALLEVSLLEGESSKVYSVSYTPSTTGRHTIHVQWEKEAVPGSPVIVEIGEGPATPIYAYDEPVVFNISAECINADSLTSYAVHQDSGTRCNVSIGQVSPGKFDLTLSPNDPGIYLIYALLNSVEIAGSPYKIRYAPKPPKPNACMVSIIESKAFVDEPIHFTVDTAEAGCGDLHVQAAGAAALNGSAFTVTDNEDKTYSIDYIPRTFGDLQLHITWSGQSVPGSPFNVLVSEHEPDVKTALMQDGTLNIVEVESPVTLYITNVAIMAANCSGKLVGAVNVPITQDGSRRYRISFSPRFVDSYRLTVKLESGEPLTGSPFLIRAVEKGSLSTSHFHSHEGTVPGIVEVGTPMNLVVQCDVATISAISTDGPLKPCETAVTGQVEGFIGLGLTPELPGVYLVNFKQEILGQEPSIVRPYTFRVKKVDSGASKLSVLQEDLVKFRTRLPFERGCSTNFRISIAKNDVKPGNLSIEVKGPGKSQIKIFNKKNDNYPCCFSPSIPGKYFVNVLWNGDDIVESPFMIAFKPGRSRAITGLDLENETYYVDMPHHFRLFCSAILGEGKPTIECKPASAAKINVSRVKNSQSYQCEIIPLEVGNHEVMVRFNDKNIIGSPFNVSFELCGSASKCRIVDSPAEKHFDIGDKITFLVSTKEAGKGKLTVSAENRATGDQINVPVDIVQVREHEHEVTFIPVESAEYLLNVLYNEVHIPLSPLNIVVSGMSLSLTEEESSPPATRAKCDDVQTEEDGALVHHVKAYGPGLEDGFVGQEGNFVVETVNAGQGLLDVQVGGPMGAFKVNMRQHPDNDRTILIHYNPAVPGSYSVSVTWSGVHVPGSPFTANISKQVIIKPPAKSTPPKADVSWLSIPKPISELFVGSPTEVVVKADRAPQEGEGELAAYLQSSKNDIIHAAVSNGEDHSYLCKVDEPPIGKYLMHILWAGEHITGSPLKIKVMPTSKPENVRAYGPGLKDGEVGQEGEFVVDTSEGGAGTLHILVHGPKEAFTLDMQQDPENSRHILVNYKPSKSGAFTVDLLWLDVHIPGSPFSLNIHEKSETR